MLVRISPLFGKYKVEEFDNAPFTENATIGFSAGERAAVRVHAKVANVLNGQLKDNNGTLKGMVASTMMYGSDAQMALEGALAQGFNNGMKYKVENSKVTLTNGPHTVVLAPW
ncbi:hypothetical protein ABL78_4338 [Leptomonas seymouri]|uniref:DUF306 domain-containing protein n=1 Tax=Leptomonas seymouri TaxID=5684 RepID=A0A0N0P5L5_LEPSE|nr:hypothetical protein ABL78_4338 [Leptomonas seymouri]|eukprot:KPI86609.1 hypothetical protein ABL78_4338 [Leptomonas seymouri]